MGQGSSNPSAVLGTINVTIPPIPDDGTKSTNPWLVPVIVGIGGIVLFLLIRR